MIKLKDIKVRTIGKDEAEEVKAAANKLDREAAACAASLNQVELPKPGKCFSCECACTGEDFCFGCKRYVCEGCDVNGLFILGNEHDPEEHLDDGAPDSWPEDLSEEKAAELRSQHTQPPGHDSRVELHFKRMLTPYDHPDCICTETVVGKDTCPVHGKLPVPALMGRGKADERKHD